MKIIKIKKLKTKVVVILDTEKIEILPTTYASFNLYINKIIDDVFIKELKTKSLEEDLFIFATQKLALKEFTSGKIKELLKKKSKNEKIIKNVIERLKRNGLINDVDQVDEVLERADYKHYGYKKIIEIMYNLKISPQEINKVKYDEKREKIQAELLLKEIENKFENKNEFQKKKSCAETLLRKGFSYDIVIELVNKIANSNNIHEINVLKLDYVKAYAKFSKRLSDEDLNEKIRDYLLAKGYKYSDIKYVEENQKWNGLMN